MEQCSICLTDISKLENKNNNNFKLNCGHKFHKECIMEWLKNHNTCPLCRDKMIIINYLKNKVDRPKIYRFTKNKYKFFKINDELIKNAYGQLINQKPIGYLDNRPLYLLISEKGKYYIDYYLRQIIMTCKIDYEKIYTEKDYSDREIYFTKQEIEKDRFDKNKFDIAFNWAIEVLNCFNDLLIVDNMDDYYSLITDLLVIIIKKFKLGNHKFQTAIIVSIYHCIALLSKKSLRDLGIDVNMLIYYTAYSSLRTDFQKYSSYINDYKYKYIKKII